MNLEHVEHLVSQKRKKSKNKKIRVCHRDIEVNLKEIPIAKTEIV
jgi:hypothetical protein